MTSDMTVTVTRDITRDVRRESRYPVPSRPVPTRPKYFYRALLVRCGCPNLNRRVPTREGKRRLTLRGRR